MMITMNHIIYGPVSMLVSWMFKNMKSVNVFRTAAVLMAVSAWLRLLAFTEHKMFSVLFVFNTVFTMAGPVIYNGLSILTISWFKEKEKAKAASIFGLGGAVGGLLGVAIPGVVAIGLDKHDPEADLRVTRNSIFVANCLVTVLCILFLIFFQSKPKNPPSKLALEAEKIASSRRS